MLLIKNGRVLDPASKTDAKLDVLLDGDRIANVGANLSVDGAEVFDANGMIVAPGFIDLHCHLREPGQEMSETIETGSKSAARGGFKKAVSTPTLPFPHMPRIAKDNSRMSWRMQAEERALLLRAGPLNPSTGSTGTGGVNYNP